MTLTTPAPPPLPDELERLARRLRLPYLRKAAPEVLATARAQRWDPAEVVRVLLIEEAAGRDKATIRMRRRASGLPAGKTFDVWDEAASAVPAATQHSLRTWNGSDEPRTCVCADPAAPANRTSSKRSGTSRSTTARPSPGTPWNRSPRSFAATAPTTPSTEPSPD